MAPPVIGAGPDQLDELATLFARAFTDEPVERAMFPRESRRAALMPCHGALVLHLSYLDGKVIETTPSLSCLSIWTPPGQATSLASWFRSGPRILRMLARSTPADVRRFATFFTRLEKRRHALLPQPHWCLEPCHSGRMAST